MKNVSLSTFVVSSILILGAFATENGPIQEIIDKRFLQTSFLNSTNTFRRQHSAAALKWNDTLAQSAQAWANKCKWKHSGAGENLGSLHRSALAVNEAWSNERDEYDFSHPGFSKATGHFTQVVWKNTKTIGCAVHDCGKGDTGSESANGNFWVCHYYPVGNIVNDGEFAKNVQRQVNSELLSEQDSDHSEVKNDGNDIPADLVEKEEGEDRESRELADDESFKAAILNSTNTYRHQHGAKSLQWNVTLAQVAEDWTEGCVWEHSGGPSGENLAAGYSSATDAIEGWGNEREKYSFDNQGFSKETGHFTQLVWKDTTTVGCARKKCNKVAGISSAYFLVCEYFPPGNFVNEGAFEENVQEQANSDQLPDQDTDEGEDGNDVHTMASLGEEHVKPPTLGAGIVSVIAMAVNMGANRP